MIDRLEVLVPEEVPKREENWRGSQIRPAKGGTVYAYTLNEDFQLALRVHFNFRVPIAKRHLKVDFTDTRLMTADDLLWRLTWMFRIGEEQARAFRVQRIDFAADVFGVPVEWFKRHCQVKRKRKTQSYEVCRSETSKGAVTSVVFGKRPDLYRIYDRVAEKLARGAELLYPGVELGAPAPIITRVERQCSGRSIPKAVGSLGALFENAAEIEPFPGLVCRKAEGARISHEDWAPQMWLMSLGLATAVRELGEAIVRARLNRRGNAARIFDRYSGLLRADSPGVTAQQLREVYRRSTVRQLNLPIVGEDGTIRYPAKGRLLTL